MFSVTLVTIAVAAGVTGWNVHTRNNYHAILKDKTSFTTEQGLNAHQATATSGTLSVISWALGGVLLATSGAALVAELQNKPSTKASR
jgi:hypothetical protein